MIYSKEILKRSGRTLASCFFHCYNGTGMPLVDAERWVGKLNEDETDNNVYYLKKLNNNLYEPAVLKDIDDTTSN